MLKKFCEITSCNGIIDLYESKNNKWAATFWTLTMLVMSGLSVFFTYKTIRGYIESPTVTNVGTVPAPSLDVPSILLCYLGGFDVSVMQSMFSEPLILDFAKANAYNPYNKSSEIEYTNYLKNTNLCTKQVIEKISYKCPDFVEGLSNASTGYIPCSTSQALLSDFGNCYLFKHQTNQTWPGFSGGLAVYLKQPENSFFATYPKLARQLGISNAFYITFEKEFGYQLTDRSILIPMNHLVEITLYPRRYVRVQNCNNSQDHMFSSNTCFFQYYIKNFDLLGGCIPLHFWDSDNEHPTWVPCDPFKSSTINQMHSFYQLSVVPAEQSKLCMPKCDEWVYETSLSMIPMDPGTLDHPQSMVRIFFNTMQYTQVVEVCAFTIDMAIANVGGQSGLWLGASIVTIIQAFYYLFMAIGQKCAKNEQKIRKVRFSSVNSEKVNN